MYKQLDGTFLFSPSDLINFMGSEYVTWMDRFNWDYPGKAQQDEPSETDNILQQKGIAHETEFLQQLRDSGRDVCDVSQSVDRQAATIKAMTAGREVIYQAKLRDEQFAGYADFLIRVEGTSKLGSYHYEPWDTKLALKPKPYVLIQLACYADLLNVTQGTLSKFVHVVLGDKSKKSYRTEDYFYFYRQLRQAFLEQQKRFDRSNPPDFTGKEDFGRWTNHAENIIKATDHLCQVANIRTIQIRKLKECNITTMAKLAATRKASVSRLHPDTFTTLKWQARLQIESANLAKPKWEPIKPQTPGLGLYLLPPSHKADVFFDMEGHPFAEGGLEYLFGATILKDSKPTFVDWWAHNPEEEKRTFESFIDWLYARWQKNRKMHVYHYASYEKAAMRKLSGKYGTKQDEVDALLRNEVFVDLFTVLRQSVKVGTPNYSLKSIEKLYRKKRAGEVATGQDSIVAYQKWLDENDGPNWKTSTILNQIREYNKEDCDSTWQLAEWLHKVQSDQKIVWQSTKHKDPPDGAAAEFRNEAAALAAKMLRDIPVDPELKTEEMRVRELLAYLLEFHWREAKPVFWAKYARHEMSEQELFDDPCCLSGLERVGKPRSIDRSFLYKYRFNPDQDTKIDAGLKCFYAHDLEQRVIVAEIDGDKGLVTLKLGVKVEAPPKHLSLILDEYVPAAEIAKSIFRIASKYNKRGGKLPAALNDFIRRRPPRIKGYVKGPLITGAADSIVHETTELLTRLDKSTLCIQGPPGTGKTYTAAKSIVHLLKIGKRIGVTSNSHKAIAHLMDKVALEAKSCGFKFKGVKLQNESKDFHVESLLIKAMTPQKFFEESDSWQLVGGTAWAFSKEVAIDLVDYLFVDEAGQVSVANLVGMAASTCNIVLIGDQMQLSQPLQGTHPGESGKSVLEYLMGDKQVIPDDFGVFLGISRRMHPEVCSFISGAVYEDRLHSHPDTANRILQLPSPSIDFFKQSAGILYVPVQHEGNTQDSDEEAEAIVRIVCELQKCSLRERQKRRPFDLEKDLLVVAPYNMQVRKLRQCVPSAKVGSVDRFQGQEAPVVIVSMCSSTGDASPRGLEFIFSKNRLNVAISRAQILAIIVGAPALAQTHCKRVQQMELVNLFCRIMEGTAHRHAIVQSR